MKRITTFGNPFAKSKTQRFEELLLSSLLLFKLEPIIARKTCQAHWLFQLITN